MLYVASLAAVTGGAITAFLGEVVIGAILALAGAVGAYTWANTKDGDGPGRGP
jgi:hypothetical protein